MDQIMSDFWVTIQQKDNKVVNKVWRVDLKKYYIVIVSFLIYVINLSDLFIWFNKYNNICFLIHLWSHLCSLTKCPAHISS